jgi:hypothetical protein
MEDCFSKSLIGFKTLFRIISELIMLHGATFCIHFISWLYQTKKYCIRLRRVADVS